MAAAHALDDMTVFREYEPRELKNGRYPHAWDRLGEGHDALLDAADEVLPGSHVGVKDIVRQVTGHRCQRCKHPYWVGKGIGSWEEVHPLDVDEEVAQLALAFDSPEEPTRAVMATRVHWSPCDHRCEHTGPVRGQIWPGLPAPPPPRPIEFSERWPTAGDWTRYMPVEAAYRILTVHHLNEVKSDLRWWNLAALCQRCHLTIQRKVTMENPWPWEHSAWFRPHAAAWYALRYRGEHLTYTQTMARLDELLALGQQHEQVERMAL